MCLAMTAQPCDYCSHPNKSALFSAPRGVRSRCVQEGPALHSTPPAALLVACSRGVSALPRWSAVRVCCVCAGACCGCVLLRLCVCACYHVAAFSAPRCRADYTTVGASTGASWRQYNIATKMLRASSCVDRALAGIRIPLMAVVRHCEHNRHVAIFLSHDQTPQ